MPPSSSSLRGSTSTFTGFVCARAFLAGPLELGAQLAGLLSATAQQRVRLARGDRLDAARAGADRALGGDHERPDLRGRAHVRAAAELARVAGDVDHAAPRRRTSRRRASSRRAAAPPRSGRCTRAPAGSRRPRSFTRRSTSARSSSVSACGCVKSKRSLSGRTAEPAWRAWSPSTSCSALCRRWVAVWFAIVGKRTAQGTTARTRMPSAKPSPSNVSTWSSPGSRVAATSSARAPRLLVLDEAGVGDLAAALRVEGRLLELRLEAPVAEILEGDDRRQHVRLLVAHELAARLGLQRARRPRRPGLARARALLAPSARGSRPRRPAGRARGRAPASARAGSRRCRAGGRPRRPRSRRPRRPPRRA